MQCWASPQNYTAPPPSLIPFPPLTRKPRLFHADGVEMELIEFFCEPPTQVPDPRTLITLFCLGSRLPMRNRLVASTAEARVLPRGVQRIDYKNGRYTPSGPTVSRPFCSSSNCRNRSVRVHERVHESDFSILG